MIDLHCHLLPGIDDGPPDMGSALAMARLQLEAGVRTVAATPHVSWDLPTEAATIETAVARLRGTLAAEGIPLELVTGAEIDVHRAAELPDEELRALALGHGRWLLVEAPLQQAALIEPVVHDLLDRGHAVLLAHPERSPVLQRDPAAVHRLASAGVLTQVTASSLVGRFGRTVQRFAEHLVAEGLVHSIASDAHDLQRRPPGMREAIVEAGLGDLAALLTEEVPTAILTGEPIPLLPRSVSRAPRRGLRAVLRRR